MKDVELYIDKWVLKYLGNDFVFRPNQKEIIIDIINNVLDNSYKVYTIEAPTGMGKSLINIISAGVLWNYFKIKSYILCSDLFLYNQYVEFVHKYKLNFGYLKGQSGNYRCDLNGEDLKNGECRISSIPWTKMCDDEIQDKYNFQCAKSCKYCIERSLAKKCGVTIMTYQLWLYLINILENTQNMNPFGKRNLLFCDECHNIPQIIQSQYSATINKSSFEKLYNIYNYYYGKQNYSIYNKYSDVSCIKDALYNIYNNLLNEKMKTEDILNECVKYYEILDQFSENVINIQNELSNKRLNNKKITKSDLSIYKDVTWYLNYHCFWNDFINAIIDTSHKYIIKEIGKANHFTNEEESINLNCAKEDYLIYRYLINNVKNLIFISATIGDEESFKDNIGAKYFRNSIHFTKLKSFFDFSKSPIYCMCKYKMNYSEKEKSFQKLKPIIYKILNNHISEKGIIQTGNYENAKLLYNNAPQEIKNRLIIYYNSKDKEEKISMFKKSKNKVLIGPTLYEGIDFKDDLCRFIIILKVPFPSLANKLVKAKINLFPKWYNSTTSNLIIQGIGRGVRNENDYCETYILDGCFNNLYNKTKNQYPNELKNRLVFF